MERRVVGLPARGSLWLLLGLAAVSGCRCGDEIVVSINEEPPETLSETPSACVDADGDGLGVGQGCDAYDCDDTSAAVGANAQRDCYSGPADTKGTGACGGGLQTCTAGVWAELCAGETVPLAETCDGVDNDCDGAADQQIPDRTCYTGPEGTDGVGACVAGTQACSNGGWAECTGEVLPQVEVCDGIDNDCDGEVDEALVQNCYDGPAGTEGVGICAGGTQTCTAGAWGACTAQVLPSTETCDAVDNDCNGSVDEALVRGCYDGPAGTAGVGACVSGTQTCSVGAWGACTAQVLPSAETCDAVDNDCNGAVDEALVKSCYDGPAGTAGVGVCAQGSQTCSAGTWGSCNGQVLPATETCDAVDNDCNGAVDEALVKSCYDGPAGTSGVGVCAQGSQTCSAGAWGSCDGDVLPSAETCDDLDNDCNGSVDEQLVRSCYDGASGTTGVGACVNGTQTCSAGAWGTCAAQVTPTAETCDGIDNDCDGEVDEALVRSCYDGPAGTSGVGVCTQGSQTCSAGAWSTCDGDVLPATETCDAVDNDCDGTVDEQLVKSCYDGPDGTQGVGACGSGTATCSAGAWSGCTAQTLPSAETCDGVDNDCDGSLDEELVRSCYDGPAGTAGVGACVSGSQTCAVGAWSACGSQVLPSTETCDAVDNDCDGTVDEQLVKSCYTGPGGTQGVGACSAGTSTCSAGAWGSCAGEALPSAESCDAVDNDCDGTVDEALVRSCYGGPAGTEGVGACSAGTETCAAGAWGACTGDVKPATEVCDAIDNDCDGSADEALSRACYGGPNGTSGVGVCTSGSQSCSAGAWGTCLGEVTPSAETCDNADNDCDGSVDDALTRSCYSGPPGTAGVGVCTQGTETCAAGAWGSCAGQVLPSNESCDNADNNCDGTVDESLTRSCYPGQPGTEGVGICSAGSQQCAAGAWGTCDGAVVPVTETCDAADNNCNGSIDENVTRYGQSGSNQPLVPRYRPVDIIFVIDNSGSMSDEIAAVEQNINVNFAQIIGNSGIDYRVIMLSAYGSALGEVCVLTPLGGQSACGLSGSCPVNTSRFFHYNVPVGSHDSFSKIINTYNAPDSCGLAPNGWGGWLRPGATKYFVEITDDEPFKGDPTKPNSMDAATFDSRLLQLSSTHFGTTAGRNYVFHSIVGLHENNPRLAPWLPPDPLVTTLCTGNGGQVRTAGTEYQKVSRLTGGLRYPICEYQDFDAVFQRLASSITEGQQIACSFTLSSIPADSSLENTVLELTPTNGGQVQLLTHVSGPNACTGAGFYTTADGQIVLCPDSCQVWRDDPTAVIDVLFYCTSQVQP